LISYLRQFVAQIYATVPILLDVFAKVEW